MGMIKPGTDAPSFELEGLEGSRHALQDALGRGPLLIAFFKVSCPTCQYAFPFIERLHQQFRGHGAQVWGISQDNTRDSRSFAGEYGVTFPILIDDHPYETSDAFGIRHVPTLFLINTQGRIELVSDGFDKKDFLAIQSWLARQVSATPPALFLPGERVPEFKPG